MQVILEAVAGPAAGRRIEVRAGSILRVGRTARADYALGEDAYLSSLHFAVECDGAQCRIRDLGSSNGTFVNGSRITEQVVSQGDSVTAGGSTFTVHFEAAPASPLAVTQLFTKTAPTPMLPSRPEAPATAGSSALAAQLWPGFSPSQSNLLHRLYGPGEPVFALLDASRDSRIPAFLDASGEPFLGVDPTGRIPLYLTAPPPQSRLLDVLIKDGWSRHWCAYYAGPIGLQEACAHLADYLALYTLGGRRLTLPFWDPGVLRVLGPLIPPDEAASFFGPFTRIVVEAEKPDLAVELSLTPRGPHLETVHL
jgi:hypothetical protein